MKNMTTRIIEKTQDSNKQQEDLKKLKDMSINSNYPNKKKLKN